MKNNPALFATKILLTQAEIQEILYKINKHRRTTSILCLHSLCFQHAILHKINLQRKLILMTSRKFFGSYSHCLIKHASEQYRLFSGRTSNTEKDEATLKSIKMFTSLSSNISPLTTILITSL